MIFSQELARFSTTKITHLGDKVCSVKSLTSMDHAKSMTTVTSPVLSHGAKLNPVLNTQR